MPESRFDDIDLERLERCASALRTTEELSELVDDVQLQKTAAHADTLREVAGLQEHATASTVTAAIFSPHADCLLTPFLNRRVDHLV